MILDVAWVQNAERQTFLCCNKMEPFGPEGVGKPRETWRITIESELSEMSKTWNEFKWRAQDRFELQKLLCAYYEQENESSGKGVRANDVDLSPNSQWINDDDQISNALHSMKRNPLRTSIILYRDSYIHVYSILHYPDSSDAPVNILPVHRHLTPRSTLRRLHIMTCSVKWRQASVRCAILSPLHISSWNTLQHIRPSNFAVKPETPCR